MAVRKRAWMTRKGEQKTAWVVDYRDQSGKRHIETCVRKKDADAREAQVRINIKSGTHVAPSDSLTVAEAAQGWIKEVVARGREEGTLHQYRQHVRTHIVPRIGRVKLAKLTDATLSHFRDELLKALSRATARKVLTSTKMILKQAKFGHVAAAVSIERSKRERRLEAGIDFPDTGEIRRLIAAAPKPRQKALLLTVALTGLRASELRGLRWRDVDFKVGELHVRQRADLKNVIGAPKSRSSNRTVPLPPELVVALQEWKLKCPKQGNLDLVFPTTSGAISHHANTLRMLARVMCAAGVVESETGKPKYALHAFRHFFASWCINPEDRGGRGLPPKVVQDLLGHSSIVMTMDVYGHLFPSNTDRSELAKASRLLLQPPPDASVVPLRR
jgi:integrase